MTIDSLKTLTADPKNRRKHNPRNLEMIQASLAEVGASRSIVIDETGEILAGNGLVLAAMAQGLDRVQIVDVAGDTVVAVRRSGLTVEQKRALAIYDNRTAELAEWDWEQLEADRAAGLPLEAWWSPEELSAEANTPKVGRTDPDAIPALGSTAITAGDLFELGGHRLLCGDATLQGDVGRLMGNDRAAVCLTDPPYGIGLEYDGFDDSEEAVRQMAGLWLPLAREVSDVVTFSPGVTRQWLYPEPAWVLCWFYGGGQLRSPWGFNCWQPFLCYGADPSLARGHGCRPDAVDCNTPANSQDLAHPCPKPVALWSWLLQRLTFEDGAIVLDLFAGAGTGFIAAEQHHRRCFALEQSPRYCQVAIDRWEAFTGQTAVKVGEHGRS